MIWQCDVDPGSLDIFQKKLQEPAAESWAWWRQCRVDGILRQQRAYGDF